jgi:hypothetical protein
MSQVVLEEGLADLDFVRRQTDLPLLVRLDTRRFLRASDLKAEGLADQFYWLDARVGRVVEAPRDTLEPGDLEPALDGGAFVILADGSEVEVRPAMDWLREMLDRDYTPEKVQAVTGIHPETTRALARKIAAKRTRILMGWNSGKYYHGDLMDRAMSLLLGLTGNWGKAGTGLRSWAVGLNDGMFTVLVKSEVGTQATQETRGMRDVLYQSHLAQGLTDEMAAYETERTLVGLLGLFVPPAFFWYYHCGYREVWNRREWSDPAMKRTFDEYFEEAVARGWWGIAEGARTAEPRFLIEVGGNLLRRQRGGARMLLEHLWPTATIVSVDGASTRRAVGRLHISAAQHYEKVNQLRPMRTCCSSRRRPSPRARPAASGRSSRVSRARSRSAPRRGARRRGPSRAASRCCWRGSGSASPSTARSRATKRSWTRSCATPRSSGCCPRARRSRRSARRAPSAPSLG